MRTTATTYSLPNPRGAASSPGVSPPPEPTGRGPSKPGSLREGIRIGRWFGIEIRLELSWFIIFAFLTLSFAGKLSLEHPALAPALRWAVALGASLLFFGSILLHELSHSVVSLRSGVQVHGITLFFFGGVSHLASEPKRPKDELLIAIVGPLTSAALGAAFLGLAGLFSSIPLARSVASWLGTVNLGLAVFNLIPGFPLDGGRVLKALIWAATKDARKAQRLAITAGRFVSYGLILAGAILAFGLGLPQDGLWIGFMGWYLLSSAHSGRLQLDLAEVLGRLHVRDLMHSPEAVVRKEDRIESVVNDTILARGFGTLFVCDGSTLQGLVTLHEIKRVPRDSWGVLTIGEIMVPADRLLSIDPADSLLRALERMNQLSVGRLPVLEKGALAGIITREDVLRVLATHVELERSGPASH